VKRKRGTQGGGRREGEGEIRTMKKSTQWIVWILLLSAFAAYKVYVSPTDAELYEKLEKQSGGTQPNDDVSTPRDPGSAG
jgi:hypothetical protein